MSAVASTMTPALPPSSSTTFFLPARSFIRQPTLGLPVNVSSLKRSSATIRSPSSRVIGRMDTEPAGGPAASMISAIVSIVSGSADGGLSTIGLPEAIAGASLWAARFNGKLNGLIAAIGPIGKRRVMPSRSLRRGQQVERDDLAGHPFGLLGAEAERQDGPIHLDEGIADRLARLERDEATELLAPLPDPGADLAQDAAALVGGQLAGDLEGGDRGLDGFLVLLGRRVVGRAGRGGGVGRVVDGQDVGRLDPAAGEEDGVRFGGGDDGHAVRSPARAVRCASYVRPATDPHRPRPMKGTRHGSTPGPARRSRRQAGPRVSASPSSIRATHTGSTRTRLRRCSRPSSPA